MADSGQGIDQIVSAKATKQVMALREELKTTNEQLVQAILNAQKFDSTLSKTRTLKDQNTVQAKVNTEMLKANKLRDQAIIIEQRKQQAILKTAEIEQRAAAKKAADEAKAAKIENAKIVAMAKKGKTIISNSQLEIDAYNNSVNGSKKVTSAMTAAAIAENKVASAAAAVVSSNQKVTVSTLKVSKAAVDAQKSINSLKIQLQSYQAIAESTGNNDVLVEFNGKIKETESAIEKLKRAGTEGFDELGNKAGEADTGIGDAVSTVKDLIEVLPGITVASALAFASGPILNYIASLDIFKNRINQAEESRKMLNEVNLKGAKDAQAEIVQLKVLYDTAKNLNLTSEQRYNAVKRLQGQYPKTFENYTIEQIQLGKVDAGYLKLTQSIIATAKARASEEKIAENSSRLLDNEQKLIELRSSLTDQTKALSEAKERANKLDKEAGDRETAGVRGDAQLRVKEISNEIRETSKQIRDLKSDTNILDQRNLELTKNIVKAQKEGADIADITLDKPGKVDTSAEDSRKSKFETARAAAKEIATNEKESYQIRLLAETAFAEAGENIAKVDYDRRVELAKGASGKITAAQSEYQKDLEKYQREARALQDSIIEDANKSLTTSFKEGIEKLTQREKDEIQIITDANNEKLALIEQYRSEAVEGTSQQYADGIITKKQYDQTLLEIEAQAAQDRIQVQIDALKLIIKKEQDYLEFGIGTNKEIGDDQKKLAQLEISLSKLTTDAKIKDKEKVAEASKRLRDTEIELSREVLTFGISVVDGLFTKRLNSIQGEIDAGEKKRAADIENVNSSVSLEEDKADRIAIVNARADAQQRALDQRQREEKVKQAQFDKAASAANIIANTAVAIMKTYAEFGWPIGVPLAIAQGAIGALQLATVLTTPIPKFEHGGTMRENGLAMYGEVGHELMIDPSGKLSLTPDKPTIGYVKAGTEIISNKDLMRMMAKPDPLVTMSGNNADLTSMIHSQEQGFEKVTKAIKAQKQKPGVITPRAWFTSQKEMDSLNVYLKRNLGR